MAETAYSIRTIYKDGKRVGWPELYCYQEFQGIIVNGCFKPGKKENGYVVSVIGSDCVCKVETAEQAVVPKVSSRYDETGRWIGYYFETPDIQCHITPYKTFEQACQQKGPAGLTVVEKWSYSKEVGLRRRIVQISHYLTQDNQVIRIQPLPDQQHERD